MFIIVVWPDNKKRVWRKSMTVTVIMRMRLFDIIFHALCLHLCASYFLKKPNCSITIWFYR